jgi:hypothetical protein
MKTPWLILKRRYNACLKHSDFLPSVISSIAIFGVAFYINEIAINFATERISNPVTDIILSNTPALPVDDLFIYSTFLFGIISVALCIAHPRRIPFVLKAAALFFVVRSVFTSLTHLAPFGYHLAEDFGATINNAFFGGDLFFSGHTGLPFLGTLVYWNELRWRYFYLAFSIFFAIVVLLGHIHYSIDVASAFFITYGIYHIALYLFPKDHRLFVSKELE